MMPSEWENYMREHPEWWLLTRKDRLAERKARRERDRTERWGPRANAASQS